MRIRVLGSAAGGGFPQWNCNCPNCSGLRRGTIAAYARTQSSIAVSTDHGADWVLVNASPDIRAQLLFNADLHPARSLRDSAIAAIVLVDGQVDHTTGLYMLRESSKPLELWCTEQVYTDITEGNPILKVLQHYCGVNWNRIDLGARDFVVPVVPNLRWRALPVASKPAPFSPHRMCPQPGDNIALEITDADSGTRLLYAPGVSAIDELLWEAMSSADCVLIDGTFWTEDEMIQLGASRHRAGDMGHLPQSGSGNMLEWLEKLPSHTRTVLIHINNTNPILDEDSSQRRELTDRGVEVAYDGMDIDL